MRSAITKIILISAVLIAGMGALCISIWARVQAYKPESPDPFIVKRAKRLALAPPQRMVHQGQMLGVIQVPSVGLAIPIVEGTEDESLKIGAGHVPRTAFPGHHGNSGIAAHRDTCFRPLRFIHNGDDVVITTPSGVHDYVVTGTEIVTPADGRVLHRTSTRTLTLVTCYPFFYVGSAPKRFIVHAEER